MKKESRDVWVDNIKVIACILVVLGHFFQSMVKSDILPGTILYKWFDNTIYCFHVQLFFICSGFLYQKYSKVNDAEGWIKSFLKKLLSLGVPYFFFSTVTWILKKAFSGSVNDQIGGLGDTLFLHPTSPYWYLYILFFIFLITWTTKTVKQQLVLLLFSFLVKLLGIFGFHTGMYFIDKTMDNWFWFVFGMCIVYGIIISNRIVVGILSFGIFIVLTVLNAIGSFDDDNRFLGFILSCLACYGTIVIIQYFFREGNQNKIFAYFAKYTMPIFLMHTLFAAPLRSVLLKLGITSAPFHIVIGLAFSFVGPIVAMIVLEKVKPLDFIVYPTRYIKIGK